MKKQRICGMDCPYWQPTGISRCEGVCAITGELTQDGNACNVPDHDDEYQPDHVSDSRTTE